MFIGVQHLLWNGEPSTSGLYGKYIPYRTDASYSQSGHLVIRSAQRFCSDSYFNSVFESHWIHHASVAGWKFAIELSGEATVRVMRRSELGVTTIQEIEWSEASERAEILVSPNAASTWSRLYFEIDAHVDTFVLDAEWSSDVDTVRDVSLIACCCTFNREEYLLRNLETILRSGAAWIFLRRLTIVNHGLKDLAAPIQALDGDVREKVLLINQDNYGGSGGFARAMLESMSDETATHIILMDDDIVIDPEIIYRTGAFLAICHSDTVLGGQMLDHNAPAIMHEAGAVFSQRKLRVQALYRDADVRDEKTLDALSGELNPDYNAWFYFAASLRHVRHAGLPFPFFLYYDDVEYGFRLREHGIVLAVVPGIAIWHRPGYLTDNRWKTYYYLRNLLIINALYGVAPDRAIAVMILRRCFSWLRCGDLARVKLIHMAIIDYLNGKETLTFEPSKRYAEVRSLFSKSDEKLSRLRVGIDLIKEVLRLQILSSQATARWRALRVILTSPEWWRGYLGIG